MERGRHAIIFWHLPSVLAIASFIGTKSPAVRHSCVVVTPIWTRDLKKAHSLKF
jgi:hypothetical protein